MSNCLRITLSLVFAAQTFSGQAMKPPMSEVGMLNISIPNPLSVEQRVVEGSDSEDPLPTRFVESNGGDQQTTMAYIPTATRTPPAMETFYYSYYYPDLLADIDVVEGVCVNQTGGICYTINCFDYDLTAGRCRSPMSSGLDWHDYVGRSVACGYEYSLGTVFRVLAPAEMAGDYPCLDYCPSCTGQKLLDFLSASQDLPWHTPLIVQILE